MGNKLNCILLVDDDEATNFINTALLKKAKVTNRIEVALNGLEALDYLQTHMHENRRQYFPEIIFLDINMPVMDGWEFIIKNLFKKTFNESGTWYFIS